MLNPLISVIVPVYKAEQYLDACVTSIVNQTYKNLEIILIDDGSPDRSPQLCDMFALTDARIKVVHRNNGGAAAARNTALKMAQGDYIGFVDSDDYCHAAMFETLLDSIEFSDKNIAYCLSYHVRPNGEAIPTAEEYETTVMDTETAINAIFSGMIDTGVCSKLFKKEVFNDLKFPEGEINEEFPILIPLVVKSHGIVCAGKQRYYHRENALGVTSSIIRNEAQSGQLHKNLRIMKAQLDKYQLPCHKEYRVFSACNAFCLALVMEKNYPHLSAKIRDDYAQYRRIMKEEAIPFFFSAHKMTAKIQYILVLSRLLRPLYKLFYKAHL